MALETVEDQLRLLDARLEELTTLEAEGEFTEMQVFETRDRILKRIDELGGIVYQGRVLFGPEPRDPMYPEERPCTVAAPLEPITDGQAQ